MQKFDFEKWLKTKGYQNKQGILGYERFFHKKENGQYSNIATRAVQACSEHYEEQIKQKLAAIDAEIKIVKKHELEAKKLHNMQGMSSHLDKLEHILKGLQKARDIIAGEGD
jgi:hypothetical protein